MLLSDFLFELSKEYIRTKILTIDDNFRNIYLVYMNIDITSGNKKYYLYSDIYLDDNRDWIVRQCLHNNDKDPKYRHAFRLIENNIQSDLEFILTRKLTKLRISKNKDFIDEELSTDTTYKITDWNIPISQ